MRKLLALCVVLLAMGCGDSTAPTVSAAGTWTLKSVNGFPVPFTAPQGNGDYVELTSDVITATATGTFTQTTVVKTSTGGQVTTQSIPDNGTYSVSGNSVTFTFASGSPSGSGTIDGNTLTVTTDITLVYTRPTP
jgi:hypothetical protein